MIKLLYILDLADIAVFAASGEPAAVISGLKLHHCGCYRHRWWNIA